MSELWAIERKEGDGDWLLYMTLMEESQADNHLRLRGSETATFRKVRYLRDESSVVDK
jgi:hypothetical protein